MSGRKTTLPPMTEGKTTSYKNHEILSFKKTKRNDTTKMKCVWGVPEGVGVDRGNAFQLLVWTDQRLANGYGREKGCGVPSQAGWRRLNVQLISRGFPPTQHLNDMVGDTRRCCSSGRAHSEAMTAVAGCLYTLALESCADLPE